MLLTPWHICCSTSIETALAAMQQLWLMLSSTMQHASTHSHKQDTLLPNATEHIACNTSHEKYTVSTRLLQPAPGTGAKLLRHICAMQSPQKTTQLDGIHSQSRDRLPQLGATEVMQQACCLDAAAANIAGAAHTRNITTPTT